jgi:hypothetical protein
VNLNVSRDPLEEELSAMRPFDLSPRLRRRLDGRLSADRARRAFLPVLVAGAVAAACLAAAIVLRREHGVTPSPKPASIEVVRSSAARITGPTVIAYQHALVRSPEEFELLLDKDAVPAHIADAELAPAGVLVRSNAVLNTLLGED